MKESVYRGSSANAVAGVLVGLLILAVGLFLLYSTATGQHVSQGGWLLSGVFCLVGVGIGIGGVLTAALTHMVFDKQGFRFQTLGTPELVFLWEQIVDVAIERKVYGKGSVHPIVTVGLIDVEAYLRTAPEQTRGWIRRNSTGNSVAFDAVGVSIDADALELEFRMRSPNPEAGGIPGYGPRIIVFAPPPSGAASPP